MAAPDSGRVRGRCLAGMGLPRKPAVEVTPDGRVYLIDNRNNKWRVYDIGYGPPHAAPFHFKTFRPPHAEANNRYFVAPGGKYRSYRFTRESPRDISAETLNAQLRESGFPETKRFDGAKHYTPGRR
jgi:hypothetical protein